MNLHRHPNVAKDLKSLKRFAAPEDSLGAWERLFAVKGLMGTPAIDPFPGFGSEKIFKARVIPLKENIGKSNGYRLILRETAGDCFEVLVFSRHGIYHDEAELIALIKERLGTS